jgi:outer membrane protein assembly factor BamB
MTTPPSWRRRAWVLIVAALGCARPSEAEPLLAAATEEEAAAVAASGDWPQFRGPKRDGVSDETGMLTEWPKDGPKLVWKATGLGEGFSTVAVAGNRVFTMGDAGGSCQVFAIDRARGTKLWATPIGKTGGSYAGPRCTPTADGERVYALGQHGDLVCLDAAKGTVRWKKNMQSDFGGRPGGWSYTESPLIDGERLICTPGGKGATMVALDKTSGKVVWKASVPGDPAAGYSSAVIAEVGGVRHYVQLTADMVIGVAAKDGKLLWQYGKDHFGGNTANIPSPVVNGDEVFCVAGYGRGGGLVKLTAEGGKVSAKEVYFKRELNNKHGGVVRVGDYLYGDRDDSGFPYCAAWSDGSVKWPKRERTKGSGSAAITAADGYLYVRYNNGWVALVEATPDGYREKSTFKIPDSSSNSWPHPVVAGGRLYLREKDSLWVYDVKQN